MIRSAPEVHCVCWWDGQRPGPKAASLMATAGIRLSHGVTGSRHRRCSQGRETRIDGSRHGSVERHAKLLGMNQKGEELSGFWRLTFLSVISTHGMVHLLWRCGSLCALVTWGRYHGGRRPSSDDSLHSPTVIPPSALDKPSIMKRYHRRQKCSHSSTMVTLDDSEFVEC